MKLAIYIGNYVESFTSPHDSGGTVEEMSGEKGSRTIRD